MRQRMPVVHMFAEPAGEVCDLVAGGADAPSGQVSAEAQLSTSYAEEAAGGRGDDQQEVRPPCLIAVVTRQCTPNSLLARWQHTA